MLRRSQAPLQMLVSRLVRYEHHELTGQASRLLVAAHAVLDADVAERLASSASASTSYSTSSLHVASCAKAAASHSGALPSCSQASFQQTRGYARPAAPPMPYHIAKLVLQTVDKPKQREVPPLEPRPYTPESKRSGLIAVKAGMTQTWDEWGVRVPLTVLWVDECEVVRVKTAPCDGVNALVLGVGTKKEKRLRKAQLGEYRSAGIAPKAKLAEFQVTPDGLLPAGTKLRAAHFIAGQHVDVTGVSKGKGFQGVMKRWGFAGGPASHGATKVHRAPGAIGTRNWPGRVWKGKKMAGREGHDRVTVKNVWVYKVDPVRNLVYVRGQVPGPQGSFLYLKDAQRMPYERPGLPFPTHLGAAPREVSVAKREADPYKAYVAEVDYFEETWKGGD